MAVLKHDSPTLKWVKEHGELIIMEGWLNNKPNPTGVAVEAYKYKSDVGIDAIMLKDWFERSDSNEQKLQHTAFAITYVSFEAPPEIYYVAGWHLLHDYLILHKLDKMYGAKLGPMRLIFLVGQ